MSHTMACLIFTFTGLSIIIPGVIPGSESRHFPIDGCSTDEIDIMCLYFQSRRFPERDYQIKLCRQLFKDLQDFPHNKTAPRVMCADVYDRFSAHSNDLDIGSWYFNTLLRPSPYGVDYKPTRKRKYKNVQEVIETKTTFVQRLFSEMGDVREKVTHIAIVFLDGSDLSYTEQRQIPHIIEQQNMDIKIFIVVRGVVNDKNTVLLNDTLLLSRNINTFAHHIITMSICNQCMVGWFSFRHRHGADSLSCYKLLESAAKIEAQKARLTCEYQYGGMLVSIETDSELTFLKEQLYEHFHNLGTRMNDTGHSSTSIQVYIGLSKDLKKVAKRFAWQLTLPIQYRPLAVNNWMPGKPSGGYSKSCVVWQFDWKDQTNDEKHFSGSQERFVDGWVDVDCWDPLSSFSLCEAVLPRRIEDSNSIRINSANNESFIRALEKGDFLTYRDNIVSVSTQIGNSDFLKHLQQKESTLLHLFDCGADAGTPRYISYLFVCDYIDHCRNKRDEIFCLLDPQIVYSPLDMEGYTKKCSGVYCCDGSCLSVQWVNDGEVDCTVCDYSAGNETNDESNVLNKYLKGNETCAFICDGDRCVRASQLNDGITDCTGKDGLMDETMGSLTTADTCYNILNQIIWAPRCVLVRDAYGAVLGCRDMSHLKNCWDFQCPDGCFKCPNTYCIPQHYVLNGNVDCPTGEDEITDLLSPCTGNFACWDSKMCLHPNLVCDGHPDCPHQDDEQGCGLSRFKGFYYIAGTVTVSDYNRSIPLRNLWFINSSTRYLDLSGLDLSDVEFNLFYTLKKASFLKLSNCKIPNLYDMFDYSSRVIQELDLSYNNIQTLHGLDMDFSALENIRYLNVSFNKQLSVVRYLQFGFLETFDLSHTALSDIDESFFEGFPNLKTLDLSFTRIGHFYKSVFPSTLILETLDLRGLTISHFYEDFFNGLTVNHHMYTDSFQLCCPQIRGTNIPYHTCHAPDDAISSCFNLVGVKVQRVLLWVVATFAVLGNITVIVYRVIWDKSIFRTGYGMFVINLGISDFIMGVYLFIIAGADYYYRGMYVLYDKTWRESNACRFGGFLATLSSETSSFVVFFITLDRYFVVKFPFGEVRFSQMSTVIVIILTWVIWCLIAVIPIIFRFEIYSSNAMCLGLPLTTKLVKGWEYSFSVFIVLNLCLCLVIAYGQRVIFRAMSDNRITAETSNSSLRRMEDIKVVKQLSLVALSNLLCWFPVGVMGLMSLGKSEISNDVFAWTTVIILPINSAANPLLYTIPAIMTKWEQFTKRNPKTKQFSRSVSKTTDVSITTNTELQSF